MVWFFSLIIWVSSLVSSQETVSWQNNTFIKGGSYHGAYKYQVFQSAYDLESPAALYCDQISVDHDYCAKETDLYRFGQIGYSFSGYSSGDNPDFFSDFKDSFKRYCYLPVDGLDVFYSHYPTLKKIFYHIPALKYLVPYWVKGDVVQEVAVDTLTAYLKPLCPDIPLNVLYSDNDRVVTEEDAKVICAQLAKTGKFPNVRLVRVSLDDDQVVALDQQTFDPNTISDVVKSYEKRQWWLKNMWVSQGIVIALLLSFLIRSLVVYKIWGKFIFGVGLFIPFIIATY